MTNRSDIHTSTAVEAVELVDVSAGWFLIAIAGLVLAFAVARSSSGRSTTGDHAAAEECRSPPPPDRDPARAVGVDGCRRTVGHGTSTAMPLAEIAAQARRANPGHEMAKRSPTLAAPTANPSDARACRRRRTSPRLLRRRRRQRTRPIPVLDPSVQRSDHDIDELEGVEPEWRSETFELDGIELEAVFVDEPAKPRPRSPIRRRRR